jgi:pimeloyl-ACP methyl ester carboxylesterase
MSQDPHVVRFDVADALPADVTLGEPAWLTVRVFAPTAPRPGRTSVMTLLHGGSYDWRYYHIAGPGLSGYSMAEDMAARGHVVIVPDQYGVGESARPAAPRKANRKVAAAADDAAMRKAYALLAEGRLHPDIPPLADPLKIGVGHSMGAMVMLTEQAMFGGYDLVALLGYTNRGAHAEIDGEMVPMAFPLDETSPPFKRVEREQVVHAFHWADVSPAALAADEAMSVEYVTVMAWEAQQPDTTVADAARIRAPLFLAFGERDLSPAPTAEGGFFTACPDVTTFMLEQSAHCQNFASTRHKLWSRLDRWIGSLV